MLEAQAHKEFQALYRVKDNLLHIIGNHPSLKVLVDFANRLVADYTNELINRPKNKNGLDRSDLLRGQIIGINSILKIGDYFKQYEENEKRYNAMKEQAAKNNEQNTNKGAE